MSNLQLDAQWIRGEISRLFEACPELAEDDDLRLDMIEGETGALEFISRALSQRLEAVTMEKAIAARMADMGERKARYGRKADVLKGLIQSVMQRADIHKLELPEATLSLTKPRASVEVLNVDDLPQGFFKVERKADKAAIKKSLEAGEAVPGAELAFGSPGLNVRTK